MVYKYATNITSQVNPNAKKREKWKNVANAIGNDNKTFATSQFTATSKPTHYTTKVTYDKNGKKITKKIPDKWNVVYNHPYTLASSDFLFEIPSNAYITSVKFQVHLKVDSNVDVLAPIGNFRIGTKLYPEKFDNTDTKGYSTGWNDGMYMVVPKSNKLSSKFKTVTYTMNETELKRAGHTTNPSRFNANIMGIDLIWRDANFKVNEGKNASGNVYVAWIKCIIEYDIPTYKLKVTNPVQEALNLTYNYTVDFDGTENNPYYVNAYSEFPMEIKCTNPTKSKGTSQIIDIGLSWGTEIVSASTTHGTFINEGKIKQWIVPAKAGADYTLYLTLKSKKKGLNNLSASNTTTSSIYYFNTNLSEYDGYNDIRMYANNEFHKMHKCCATINIYGISNDDSLIVNLSPPFQSGTFTLDENSSSEGVTLDSSSNNQAVLTVPVDEYYSFNLNYCYYPTTTGNVTFTVRSSDSDTVCRESFYVEEPYDYVINVEGDHIQFNSHRIASEIDTGAVIIPCVADEIDSNMIMSESKLNMNILEHLDYIGCIPLKQTHFDPKNTYKDTLLKQFYKNKKYMGKKLAVGEDIDLNIRLPPRDVTTLLGLVDMDKPVPINANHLCFEGDALNHRGWVELYGVKVDETNPRWYKCAVDVAYLTHNLNTRFKIDKGTKVEDYTIPSLMTETFTSGENLSDTDSYFITDTDGTFYYASDYYEGTELITFNDNERNNFNIDNTQHIIITSKNPLTHTSKIAFTWSSVLMNEIKENNISRIIRLIDKKDKKIVFEYQYDDIQIADDEITASVIYRILQNNTLMDYTSGRDITFRYNASDVTLEDDNVETTTDDTIEDDIESGEAHYGTTTRLELNNGKLSIIDEGFNGKEITINDLVLADGDYYYQVEWINNNSDAETSDLECVFDFNVQDTIFTSTYADKFNNIVVSPFPVTNKQILFTREAEEGTIYYYKDDGEEFSYIVDPYYQYMNGTDMVYQGSSIFNLNYGYDIIYIQNGLVRLGFNRLTGHIYLGKYDTVSKEYITTQTFHLEKFDDVNVNSLNDDKIELQASDCVFTIYRGHPYIKVKHELEDIIIDTNFNRVWAEQVGDDNSSELPAFWDLLNDKNLLGDCVGGSTGLKSSCVVTSQVEHNNRNNTNINWSNFPNDILVGDVMFTLNMDNLPEYTDEITIDGTQSSFGLYNFEVISDRVPVAVTNIVAKDIIQKNEVIPLFAKIVDVDGKSVSNQTVYFYEAYEPTTLNLKGDKSIIQSGEEIQLTAILKDEDGSRIEGEQIFFYEIIGE